MKKVFVIVSGFFLFALLFVENSFAQIKGYTIEGEEVKFQLNLADCPKVSIEEGNIFETQSIQVEFVSIAADWNDWNKNAPDTRMNRISASVFELSLPLNALGYGIKKFKFVLNGKYWVEPPLLATNKIPVEGVSAYQNWLIDLPLMPKPAEMPELGILISGYHIELDIKNVTLGTSILLKIQDSVIHLDMSKNEVIRWKGVVSSPQFAHILLANHEVSIPIVLENKHYKIIASVKDGEIIKSQVKGSPLTDDLMSYQSMTSSYYNKELVVDKEYEKYRNQGDSVQAKKSLAALSAIQKTHKLADYNFIVSHPNSYVSLYVLSHIWKNYSKDTALTAFNCLAPAIKSSELGQKVASFIHTASFLKIGDVISPFELPNVNGSLFSLESVKGKWLLLDFWASWCMPCMRSMPTLVAFHEKYPQLNIIGISADTDKEAWLRGIAIGEMQWLQLSDLKGHESSIMAQFNITSFPTYLLVNPKGEVVLISSDAKKVHATLEDLVWE